ncbi:hypothetical protein BDF14DRAFT_1881848 [Spinellus fusiger]|nr:hypothetical protein BDF14DRAFT_1886418 [Spinellus fusiger]KAI7867464.1 hypothetical protein BDF14DRAFT_1881848 [Spinellus fusiger]
MKFAFAFIFAVAASHFSGVLADGCNCAASDHACLTQCVQTTNTCINGCNGDNTCYANCIQNNWPGQVGASATPAPTASNSAATAAASSASAAISSISESVAAASSSITASATSAISSIVSQASSAASSIGSPAATTTASPPPNSGVDKRMPAASLMMGLALVAVAVIADTI